MIRKRHYFLNTSVARVAASVVLLVALRMDLVMGQEVDPFGAGVAKAAVEKTKSEAPVEAKAEPLAIEILRSGDPQVPVDLLRAAQAALDFGRPDECKRYLAKLLSIQPKDEVLAAQTLRFGDFLFRLSRLKDVQPEGKQVADLIFAAGRKTAENTELIGELIGKLSAADSRERQAALLKLSQAGVSIVPPLLDALADPQREKEHVFLQAALVRLGGVSQSALIGALNAPDAAFKARVIEAIGHIRSSRSAAHLVRPAIDPEGPPAVREAAGAALTRIMGKIPGEQEAVRYLTRKAQRLWQGELPLEADADGLVEVWKWDTAAGSVSPQKLTKADAAAAMAARVADDLYAISPGNTATERLMLLASLEFAKSQAGLDRPLPMEAGSAGVRGVKAGPQVMSGVLADALRQAKIPAAIAAIEVLAKISDAAAVQSLHGAASPLAEAMTFSDRRVRFHAAMAAAKLSPGGQFVGASRVNQTLRWMAGAQGVNLGLVADPRVEVAQTTIGLLNSAGYEGLAAYNGRALVAEAVKNADVEFILIDDAIDSPPILDLVQWLRRDFRTARIPVGVMSRVERLDSLQQQFREDPFTLVFPRMHSEATAFTEIARLQQIAGRNQVSGEERLVQAEEAKQTLARVEAMAAASDRK